MPHEVALFWLVLAAFWLFDNLALAPPGGDLLRLSPGGRLRYLPASRLAWRGRDALWRNPLNPFDLVVPCAHTAGFLAPAAWRRAHQALRQAVPTLRALGWLGLAYQAVLLALAVLSWHWHFGAVLAWLLGWHLLAWCVGLGLLLQGRRRLGLGTETLVPLLAEALFVPAYTLGLGKRTARRLGVDLPSISVGLRAWRRMPAGATRELMGWQLGSRLEGLLLDHGIDPESDPEADPRSRATHALAPWAEAARRCLQQHG
jgi:hypothetical protein